MHREQLSRLKKMVAAKDAQIEALSSRIEVLTDDLHEMRAEKEYAGAAAMRLQQSNMGLQRELEAHHERATRLQAELLAANRRADEAVQATEAAEQAFGAELVVLRDLAAQRAPAVRGR